MLKVLLPQVFLEAQSTLTKNLKASFTQIIGTSSLAQDDKTLNNPFVDFLSISKVFPNLGPRYCIIGFIDPILHNGVFPEPK